MLLFKSRRKGLVCSLITVVVLLALFYLLALDSSSIRGGLTSKGQMLASVIRGKTNSTQIEENMNPILKKLSEIEQRIDDKYSSFQTKLEEIRNMELANLESKDTIVQLAANLTNLRESLHKQEKTLSEKVNELRNIDLETIDRLNTLSSKWLGSESAHPSEEKKLLNRTLLILAGSAQDISAQTHLEESHPVSKLHRDLLFGGRGRDSFISDKQLFDTCAPGCEFTSDPARFNQSDVVIFYAGSTAYRALQHDVIRAFPQQRFVFFYFEQPHNFAASDLEIINRKVGMNWTLHYQQDATVRWPYGIATRRSVPFHLAPDYSSSKTRKILWVVSRCSTPFAHREHYVAELIKYIDIDVYGKCIEGGATRVPMDVKKVAGAYKFIISFENGDCDDYITEKYFRYNKEVMIVPIVLGRKNHYEQLVPPYSYIQADEFESPQQLAAYLHVLDKDSSLYRKYFEWRIHYSLHEKPNPFCDMCQTFRDKWFEPSQINMHQYHGQQRCWKAGRSVPVPNWYEKVQNYTFTDPWETIKSLNSKDKPLRFP